MQVSDDTLSTIFGTILEHHLSSQSFPGAVKAMCKDLVAATLAVYSAASTKLLPTPAKSHYLFNPRDFARVVQVRLAQTCMSATGCHKPAQATLCISLHRGVGS